MEYAEFPNSTAIAWASYDRARRLLRAAYRQTMRVYAYKKVPPREFQGLLQADSKGIYINRFIERVYEFEEGAPKKTARTEGAPEPRTAPPPLIRPGHIVALQSDPC